MCIPRAELSAAQHDRYVFSAMHHAYDTPSVFFFHTGFTPVSELSGTSALASMTLPRVAEHTPHPDT